MTALGRSLRVAVCIGAVSWGAGCLNPRPEDFPSRKEVPGSDDPSNPDGMTGGGTPRDPSEPMNDVPLVPDPMVPADDEDPEVNDPGPGFSADAGLSPDGGVPDGGVLDAD